MCERGTEAATHLKPRRDGLELVFGDLRLAPRHVGGLLGVERVGDAPRNENVQLDPPLPLLLLPLLLLLEVDLRLLGGDGRRRGRRPRQRVGPGRADTMTKGFRRNGTGW